MAATHTHTSESKIRKRVKSCKWSSSEKHILYYFTSIEKGITNIFFFEEVYTITTLFGVVGRATTKQKDHLVWQAASNMYFCVYHLTKWTDSLTQSPINSFLVLTTVVGCLVHAKSITIVKNQKVQYTNLLFLSQNEN